MGLAKALDKICPFIAPRRSLRPRREQRTGCLVPRTITLGSDFLKESVAVFPKQGLCIGRGVLGRTPRKIRSPLGYRVRLSSLKEGLSCREATTDPKLMIFAILGGNVNVPILVAIRAEEVPPIGNASMYKPKAPESSRSRIQFRPRHCSEPRPLTRQSPSCLPGGQAGSDFLRSRVVRNTWTATKAIRSDRQKSTR